MRLSLPVLQKPSARTDAIRKGIEANKQKAKIELSTRFERTSLAFHEMIQEA
jgi:hypothetical protein